MSDDPFEYLLNKFNYKLYVQEYNRHMFRSYSIVISELFGYIFGANMTDIVKATHIDQLQIRLINGGSKAEFFQQVSFAYQINYC